MAFKDLGAVTAYAYAVQGGYTGTEAQFRALLGNVAIDLSEIENLSVTVTTLPEGSQATASYSNGVLSLGLPRGSKGDTGNTGAKGDTGNGISSIELTSTVGYVKTYTITFTDGTTTTFDVTDGEVSQAELDTKADAIVDTASGSIASITDGADGLPVKSLNVSIVPKQSGSGDPSPSNVRPITGWDEVEVVRAGKNLCTMDSTATKTQNGITMSVNADGSVYVRGTSTGSFYGVESTKIKLKSGTYKASVTGESSGNVQIIWLKDGTEVAQWLGNGNQTITLSSEAEINFYLRIIGSGKTVNSNIYVQLELGSTATSYEPYQGTSYSIPLPSTVYGGTLDVTTGELVIDRAMADLGSFDWASRSSADRHIFRTLVNGLNPAIAYPPTTQIPTTAICEQYKAMGYTPISASDNYKFAIGTSVDPLLVIVNFDYSTAEDFKTAMNGVKLVYPLATPTEIQLTPTEVKSLLGDNNIYSSCGDVECEYRADTTLAFEKLKNAIISLGGNI